MRRFVCLILCMCMVVGTAGCGDDGDGSGNGAPGSITCSGSSFDLGSSCTAMYEKILGCCADKTVGREQAEAVICGMQANEAACGAAGAAADAACAQLGVRPECKEGSGDSDTSGGGNDTSGSEDDTGGPAGCSSDLVTDFCAKCADCIANEPGWSEGDCGCCTTTSGCSQGTIEYVLQDVMDTWCDMTCTEFDNAI